MRAEGHYVDLLATRTPTRREQSIPVHAIAVTAPLAEPGSALVESVRRFGVLQPMLVQEHDDEYRIITGHKRLEAARQAGLIEVPCIVHAVDDASAARIAAASRVCGGRVAPPAMVPASAPSAAAFAEEAAPAPKTAPATFDAAVFAGAQLAQSLLTISACADLLASAPSDLTRTVAGNLVRAETGRAATLVQATRIVRGETKLARMPTSASSVLARVIAGFAAEQQVRTVGIDERVDASAALAVADADADMLVTVLSGAVLSTLALIDGSAGARVTVSAAKEESGRLAFSVSQSTVRPSASWASRAFENEWTDRPGGTASAI
jgi:hypothetical protein